MEGSESSRSRSKRAVEDNIDVRNSMKDDEEEREDVDSRKNRSSKLRKHSYADEVWEQDDSRRKSSGDRAESRRKLGASSIRTGSGDEDDYDVRRESRSSKIPRRSPEDRTEKRLTDGYLDRDGDSSRRRREDENEWDLSRRSGLKASSYENSQSKSRSKVESALEGEREKLQEKDVRSSERRENSREKGQELREQEEKASRRRLDETYVSRRTVESGASDRADTRDVRSSSDQNKHRSAREAAYDYKNESGDSRSKDVDYDISRGGRSDNKEEIWEDNDRNKGSARMEKGEEDNRSVDHSRETGSQAARDDEHFRIEDKVAGSVGDVEDSAHECCDVVENKDNSSNLDEDGRLMARDESNKEAIQGKHSRTIEGPGRSYRENEEHDQGRSDSDNERSMTTKDKTREDVDGDDKSYRGRDKIWNDINRDQHGSKDYWRNRQRLNSKEVDDFDPVTEWRHGQERLDGGSFHGRAGYKRDSRARSESIKGSSAYGNRYESSDSIEIRPNRNLDFGREGSVSGRRPDMGSHQDFLPGTNEDKWINPSEDRTKGNYGCGEDMQERCNDDVQNMDNSSARGSIDSPSGRGRGFKGGLTPNYSGANQSGNSSFSPIPQQGPKGGRPSRGGRGRPNGRDSPRIGVPMPMMAPPPFGHLGLAPGPMQPMGPNMTHSAGPLGPGVFMPPFPGPLVWPGARGVDVNMLSVPPNLPIPPPVAAGPRFPPSLGAGPSHNIHLNQTGTGRGAPANVSGSGFNPVGTPSREMPHEKASAGWTPQRNSGPAGKAPSRGEQNDYSQNFVDTGMRPQNFIRELELTSVVEDYPKLRELIQRKDEIVAKSASPPMYYKCDLREHVLSPDFFGTKFDVILVDPPWEEYVHRAPGITDHIEYWNSEEIMNLKIEAIADTPSFIFLWVGDGVGLEQGRQCLKKWGFRRCEDICWVKTNKRNATPGLRHDSRTLFQHSKEHCLMGIKGTVRRSTDGHIIHANIDTDIIIAEEPSDGSTKKPEDMYRIIEHFALGRRRLELFGEDHNIRPGWLTLGKGLSSSNYNKEAYMKSFSDRDGKVWQGGGGRNPPPEAPHLVVTTPEIENLRPKSPPQKNQQQQSIPPLGSSSSVNRRPAGNSPQNSVTVVGSEPPGPSPWGSSPMVGFGMPEGGAAPDSNIFDNYGFSTPYGRPSGDHVDF